jgi:hypothetical protein
MRRGDNGSDDNCNIQGTFQRCHSDTMKLNMTFRVDVCIFGPDMLTCKMSFRGNMAAPNSMWFSQRTPPTGAVRDPRSPPPAPNKLKVNEVMKLKQFNAKDIQCLNRVSDIQCWYNVLHFHGRVCGVCTVPCERFAKTSCMGDTWSLASVIHTILDHEDLMYAALHSLLSFIGMFKGNCGKFCHLISNSKVNKYAVLYQIVCMANPVMGQTMAQPAQPLHT